MQGKLYGSLNPSQSCRRTSLLSPQVILFSDTYSLKAAFYTILCITRLLIRKLIITPNAPQFYLNSLLIGPPHRHDANGFQCLKPKQKDPHQPWHGPGFGFGQNWGCYLIINAWCFLSTRVEPNFIARKWWSETSS